MRTIFFVSFLALMLPLVAGAAASNCPPEIQQKYANDPAKMPTCLDNPLGKGLANTDAKDVIGQIIKGALAVLGSLTLLMMVWGGFQWLTSAGNTEKVEKGTKTMFWAIIGVILVLASYVLVNTLTSALNGSIGP